MGDRLPLILVTVGTDHHPFDRLIRWVDAWFARGGARRARMMIQTGPAAPPATAQWRPHLGTRELSDLIEEASIVVGHAGPGTVMDARRRGLVPIVVPRRRALGEVVDDHQVAFAERMRREGEVEMATDEETLHRLLDRGIEQPSTLAKPPAPAAQETLRRFEDAISAVAPRRRSPRSVRVLYVGGVGRSGTTLLDRILGEIPGVASVGELDNMWLRGLDENELCGCGKHFHDCEFWDGVGRRAFGGWERLDSQEMLARKREVDRHRYLPLMLAPGVSTRFERGLRVFGPYLLSLYRAIEREAGSEVVVDSSKHGAYALLLHQLPDLDLRIVHMVRQSHGVAYSWTKKKRRLEVPDRSVYMARYSPWTMGTRWMSYNLMMEFLGAIGVPTLRIRYEDLVVRPREVVDEIVRFAGIDTTPADLDFIGPTSVRLSPSHGASGNPMRLSHGDVDLRLDEEWRAKMGARDRRIVSSLTWPLLKRYGYGGSA